MPCCRHIYVSLEKREGAFPHSMDEKEQVMANYIDATGISDERGDRVA